jgi:hypothetical protein
VLRIACLLAAWLATSGVAAADPSPEEVDRRLAFLEARLDAKRTHARAWHWTWTGVNGGAAVGLAVLGGLADSDSDRVNLFSQSALALVGLADLYWMRPMTARDGFDPVRAMPGATPDDRRARLERAEAMLRKAARRPSGRTHWWPHLGNLVLNSAVGLGVWAAGSTKDALLSAGSGMAIGELYLWSEPQWRDDWEDYERLRAGFAREPRARWSLAATPGGVRLRCEF